MLIEPKSLISRRKFLSFVSTSAAVAAVYPSSVLALNRINNPVNKHSLDFADRKGLGPDLDAPDVERLCYALHDEKRLPASVMSASQMQSVENALKSSFQQEGEFWDDSYEIGFTYQHYGVPDYSIYSNHLVDYCERVHEFMYTKLTDLFAVNISWRRLIEEGLHVRTDGDFRGFVGRYTYYVMRAVVVNSENNYDLPYLVRSWPMERAIHYIVAGKSATPRKGTLYIIPGATSLVAPFSELLHLTFHEPSQRYAQQLLSTGKSIDVQERARIAGETVNEAAAIVLATEYMQNIGHPERLSAIHYMKNDLTDSYKFLPKAIDYMKRNGVQWAINTYLDNPAVFVKTIQQA